jgi:translation initiation factor eIF-2B subunit alpha
MTSKTHTQPSEATKTFITYYEKTKAKQIEIKKSSIALSRDNYIKAYILTIIDFLTNLKDKTLQGLLTSIESMSKELLSELTGTDILPKSRALLSLLSASKLILNLLHRYTSLNEEEDFSTIKTHLIKVVSNMYDFSNLSKDNIVFYSSQLFNYKGTFLLHGYSSTIAYCLIQAWQSGKRFSIYLLKSSVDGSGKKMEEVLTMFNIPTKVIPDSSIAFYMKDIGYVLVGADMVCANGGIINRLGTYTLAICAKEFGKPLYVFASSFKFYNWFPFTQNDIKNLIREYIKETSVNEDDEVSCDFTPPNYITCFITDLGIMNAYGVSKELFKVFSI